MAQAGQESEVFRLIPDQSFSFGTSLAVTQAMGSYQAKPLTG